MTNFSHPQHFLPTFADRKNKIINCLVEIQKDSINKYEIQKETGILKLDRVLFQHTPYPFDYGVIPMTYDADDDLLDVMILHRGEPFHAGSLVEGRVIGMIHFLDTGDIDDKIVVVPNDDYRWRDIGSIDDLSIAQKEEIDFFWNNYKAIQFKMKKKHEHRTVVKAWSGVDVAMKTLDHSIKLYERTYPDNPLFKK